MKKLNAVMASTPAVPMMSLDQFRRLMGRSDVTIWRWRRAGWLETVNISGRNYLTGKAVADFCQRATSGEFSKKITATPPRRTAKTTTLS